MFIYKSQQPDPLFNLQVKNKPNGGISFPAFIHGAGVVTKQYMYVQYTIYTIVLGQHCCENIQMISGGFS
jgi:hypothetical protein